MARGGINKALVQKARAALLCLPAASIRALMRCVWSSEIRGQKPLFRGTCRNWNPRMCALRLIQTA